MAIQGSTDVYAYTGSGVLIDDSSYFADTLLPAINRPLSSKNSHNTFSSKTTTSGNYPIPKLSTMLLLGSLAIGLFGIAEIKKRFRV